jgi:hypothetical protein
MLVLRLLRCSILLFRVVRLVLLAGLGLPGRLAQRVRLARRGVREVLVPLRPLPWELLQLVLPVRLLL